VLFAFTSAVEASFARDKVADKCVMYSQSVIAPSSIDPLCIALTSDRVSIFITLIQQIEIYREINSWNENVGQQIATAG